MTGYLYRGKPGLEKVNDAIMAARPADGQRGRRGQPARQPNKKGRLNEETEHAGGPALRRGRETMGASECPQGGQHDWGQQLIGGRMVTVCAKCGARQ